MASKNSGRKKSEKNAKTSKNKHIIVVIVVLVVLLVALAVAAASCSGKNPAARASGSASSAPSSQASSEAASVASSLPASSVNADTEDAADNAADNADDAATNNAEDTPANGAAVPNVLWLHWQQAAATLNGAGVAYQAQNVPTNEFSTPMVFFGEVYTQTEGGVPGEKLGELDQLSSAPFVLPEGVALKDVVVLLQYATPADLRVPNVVGMQAEAAVTTLHNAGFGHKLIYTYAPEQAGIVYAQYHAGEQLPAGTEIYVFVSNGPEPQAPAQNPSSNTSTISSQPPRPWPPTSGSY